MLSSYASKICGVSVVRAGESMEVALQEVCKGDISVNGAIFTPDVHKISELESC